MTNQATTPDTSAEVRPPADATEAEVRDWVRRNMRVVPVEGGFRAEMWEVCEVGRTGPNTGNVTGSSATFPTEAQATAWADRFATIADR